MVTDRVSHNVRVYCIFYEIKVRSPVWVCGLARFCFILLFMAHLQKQLGSGVQVNLNRFFLNNFPLKTLRHNGIVFLSFFIF